MALRNELSPGTRLVFQGYDFAIPDGRGICGFGPWLKPTFDLRNFPTLATLPARQEVVKAMLQQFAAMLTSLATQPNVTFINGQGTLPPQVSSWHNELHPAHAGFENIRRHLLSGTKNALPEPCRVIGQVHAPRALLYAFPAFECIDRIQNSIARVTAKSIAFRSHRVVSGIEEDSLPHRTHSLNPEPIDCNTLPCVY